MRFSAKHFISFLNRAPPDLMVPLVLRVLL